MTHSFACCILAGSSLTTGVLQMQIARAFLAIAMTLIATVFGPAALAATVNHKLGDTTVKIVISGNGGWTMVALHENESTSVRAAKATGGRLVELKHTGGRNVSFTLNRKKYSVDPNRIFTDTGIRKSLKPYSPEAHKAVQGLAAELLKHIRGRAIVALHNNTNGSYSIKSYQPGGQYARDASQVHVNPAHDPDDFFFVTKQWVFDLLKSGNYNVALQSGRVTDDGSLSVYCARQGIIYVNVEAESGHSSQQTQMLKAIR